MISDTIEQNSSGNLAIKKSLETSIHILNVPSDNESFWNNNVTIVRDGDIFLHSFLNDTNIPYTVDAVMSVGSSFAQIHTWSYYLTCLQSSFTFGVNPIDPPLPSHIFDPFDSSNYRGAWGATISDGKSSPFPSEWCQCFFGEDQHNILLCSIELPPGQMLKVRGRFFFVFQENDALPPLIGWNELKQYSKLQGSNVMFTCLPRPTLYD